MIVKVIYLEVKPDLLSSFVKEALANAQASLMEPGIVRFDLLQQDDDPLKFMLYEVYRTQVDTELHRQTAHYKRYSGVVVPMLRSERVRVTYNTVDSPS